MVHSSFRKFCWFKSVNGCANENLLYLSDCIEITSLEGLMLWCPEINQSNKTAVGIVMHDFHGLKTMTFNRIADIAYFLLAVTEIIQFCSRSVMS